MVAPLVWSTIGVCAPRTVYASAEHSTVMGLVPLQLVALGNWKHEAEPIVGPCSADSTITVGSSVCGVSGKLTGRGGRVPPAAWATTGRPAMTAAAVRTRVRRNACRPRWRGGGAPLGA